MRFFEAQRLARRNTLRLGALFGLNVVLLSALNAFFLVLVFAPGPHAFYFQKLHIHFFVVSVILFVGATTFFLRTLPGGYKLAESMGGRWLQVPHTEDEKRLQNVVEEMAIASGVPLPRIYILDGEDGVNAFAAGVEPFSMAIVVTKGSLHLLDRDELQGVIGHEFSHVLNEDMKLNMRLAAVVMAFIIFVRMGEGLLRDTSRTRYLRKRNQGALIGFVFYIFGSIGYFLGRLLQCMISQQREYLADASSAQFTRNPEGLARALAKINLGAGSVLKSQSRHEYAHIFFAEGLVSPWFSFFKTHPALTDRIRKLIPRKSLDTLFDEVHVKMQSKPEFREHAEKKVERIMLGSSVMEQIGAPTAVHLALSQEIVGRIAPARAYLRVPEVARASLALLAFRSQSQYQEVKEILREDFKTSGAFEQVSRIVDDPDAKLRVVLLHFVLETLRELPAQEKELLLGQMNKVFAQDQRLSLLEALMYLNAQLILLPGRTAPIGKAVRLSEILKDFQAVEVTDLEIFIYQNRRRSLVDKMRVVEEALAAFKTLPSRTEEFRLLCLAMKVPVPLL